MSRRFLSGLCIVAAGVACAWTQSRGGDDGRVKAIFYRACVLSDPSRGIGEWIHEIYLPDSKVVCNVTWVPEVASDGKFVLLGHANSFFGSIDERRDGTRELRPKYVWSQEEIEVQKSLANEIVALAELNRRQQEMKKSVGKTLAAELEIGPGGRRQELPKDDE